MNTLSEIKEELSNKKNIVITTHTNPDGDAIGSSLGLFHYLKKKGHNVVAVVPNEFPDFYNWMPGSDKILVFQHQANQVRTHLSNADIVFCLDYNTEKRTGILCDDLMKVEAPKILIDHHLSPDEHFVYKLSDTKASSTGELVYDFIEMLGDADLIDQTIGTCIYTSLLTDTGSFSYAIHSKRPFEIASQLVDKGIDIEKIRRLVYDTFSENRIRLLGYCLTERLVVMEDCRAAYIYLSKEDLKKFNYQIGDTEGVVNYPLSMKRINFAILITEKNGQVRLSFRSKGDFSVDKFARTYFDGGGHSNAAGGTSKKSMDETIKLLRSYIPKHKKELDYELKL